jgi:hypothetical protein
MNGLMIYLSSLHKSNGKLSFYKNDTSKSCASINLGSFFHLHDGLIRHRVTGYANGAP